MAPASVSLRLTGDSRGSELSETFHTCPPCDHLDRGQYFVLNSRDECYTLIKVFAMMAAV